MGPPEPLKRSIRMTGNSVRQPLDYLALGTGEYESFRHKNH